MIISEYKNPLISSLLSKQPQHTEKMTESDRTHLIASKIKVLEKQIFGCGMVKLVCTWFFFQDLLLNPLELIQRVEGVVKFYPIVGVYPRTELF